MMSWKRPQLKSGVDLQLQSAFNDAQWPTVIRLAEKRLRTFNDPYYEVVKICAECHLDAPLDKAAGVIAIQRYLKDGTPIKDIESLELLEWACVDVAEKSDFSATLGPLRLRFVKANPKDKSGGSRCLESCILHWDLVSAQQIAAILDKSFPQERRFLFWNIVITYMLCTSDQCPAEKRKLYGMLALKQIQRAAQLAEQHTGGESNGDVPERSIRTEEELLLLYRILETHGSELELSAILVSPSFSPEKQFQLGRKELFLRMLDVFQAKGDWKTVYNLCKSCLSEVDENGKPNLLACDWSVWKTFLTGAGQIRDTLAVVDTEVFSLVNSFSGQKDIRPIYGRNILLARVEAAFQLRPILQHETNQQPRLSSPLEEICRFVDNQWFSPACFDDIRNFIEKLDIGEMKHLAYDYVPAQAKVAKDALKSATIRALACKLQYFILTCPRMLVSILDSTGRPNRLWRCEVCGSKGDRKSCSHCVSNLSTTAMSLYRAITKSVGKAGTGHELDIIPELALVVAMCCIRLSHVNQGPASSLPSCLHGTSCSRLLQATVVLEHQLTRTPKHGRVTLLLCRLYLILGCATKARDVWNTMDVKRAIIDSLGPFFFDRISTIAPALVLPVNRSDKPFLNEMKSHYGTTLSQRMPARLADAFEAESYSSILEIPRYMERLRSSCTMAMSYLELSRAARALGQRGKSIFDEACIYEIHDETILTEAIDYGSMPNFESNDSKPSPDILRLGPGPSSARSHLALITENYFDLLSFKPPGIHKAANASQFIVLDQQFVLESLHRLNSSFNKFLRQQAALTSQEQSFYEVLSLLTAIVALAMKSPGQSAAVLGTSAILVSAITTGLDLIREKTLSLLLNEESPQLLLMLSSMHGLAHLRDAAAAIKLATSYVTAFNEREKERDRSGQSNVPKDIMAHMKTLEASASKAMSEGKERVVLLKKEIDSGTLESFLNSWTFGEHTDPLSQEIHEEVGLGVASWLSDVTESWKSNVRGWELVKWE